MPFPRSDAVFVPKVSWTANNAPTAVSYGALVGTPTTILLLPRSGTETAGFTLRLQWTQGGTTVEHIGQLVADTRQPIATVEATLIQGMPQWQGRCVFPIAQLTRFEILKGWKLWLGVSAVLQLGAEPAVALRVPNKAHLGELRQTYAGRAKV